MDVVVLVVEVLVVTVVVLVLVVVVVLTEVVGVLVGVGVEGDVRRDSENGVEGGVGLGMGTGVESVTGGEVVGALSPVVLGVEVQVLLRVTLVVMTLLVLVVVVVLVVAALLGTAVLVTAVLLIAVGPDVGSVAAFSGTDRSSRWGAGGEQSCQARGPHGGCVPMVVVGLVVSQLPVVVAPVGAAAIVDVATVCRRRRYPRRRRRYWGWRSRRCWLRCLRRR